MYLNISEISVDISQRVKRLEKSLKTAMFRPNPTAGYHGYQPDIKAVCIPDIMSCHPLAVYYSYETKGFVEAACCVEVAE